MSNLHLELLLEQIDWKTENFNTDITHLKSYNISNVTLTKKFIDDLHIEIIRTKGDWLNFDCEVIGNDYYVKINIIFNSKDLSPEDERIVDKVVERCDLFLLNLKPEKAIMNSSNNFETFNQIINEDGFVIKAHEAGGVGVAEELTRLLTSYSIPFQTIREKQSRFDGGASGGFEEIILFISGSISSGVTWDMLKGVLSSRFGNDLDNLRTSFVDNQRFKKLRKTIADRIVEDYKELVLVDFYKQDSEIACEFKVYGSNEKTITVICNIEYQIKELNLEKK